MVDCGEKCRCSLRFVSIKVHCTRSVRRLVLTEKSAAAGDDQTVSACQCVIPRGICSAVTAVCCNAVECRHRKGVVHLIRRHEHGQSACFVNRVNRLLGCKRLHRIVPRPLDLGQVMSMPMPSVRKSCSRQRQSSSMPGTMRTPSCAPRQIHSGTPLTARRSVKAASVSRSSQQRSASACGESSPPAVRLLWICRSVCAMERPPPRFRIREGFRKDRLRPPG